MLLKNLLTLFQAKNNLLDLKLSLSDLKQQEELEEFKLRQFKPLHQAELQHLEELLSVQNLKQIA
jgi:hypothetical protein